MSEKKEEFLDWVIKNYCSQITEEVKKNLEDKKNPTEAEMKRVLITARNNFRNDLSVSLGEISGRKINSAEPIT